MRPMLAGIVQIKIHLPGVGMGEFSELEVDENQTSKPTVKEQEVHPVPFVTDPQTFLPGHEREIVAEFKQEMLKMTNQSIFEVGLRVFVAQAEELQNEWIADLLLRRDVIVWC